MNLKDINYLDYGKNVKGTIVLLHGWGQNIEMMDMLGRPFSDKFRIVVLDLPGFGQTPEPNKPWSVGDYSEMLHDFLVSIKVNKPIVVGHSFGGRIAICYAAKYDTEKMVLLSSPFRPNKKRALLKTKIYKIAKKIKFLKPLAEKLKKKWGSADYLNASEINRGTLVKVVNEDLTQCAKKIKCPVLLIYGQKDMDVPITEGQALETIIDDAGLITYEDAHHYAYLEKLSQTLTILNNFFE